MTVETARVGKSIQKYLRISPRKVRPVLNTIRSQSATRAINILRTSDKKAARLILTGLKSALANAKVLKLDLDHLGFFKEKDPLTASLETKVDGIYLCGGATGPIDIAESVVQASAAAMKAILDN